MEDVIFSDLHGNRLLGRLSLPEQAGSVVILSHGFQSNKESKLYVELQNELNKVGIGTFLYDMYGHGPLYCKESPYSVTKDVTLSKSVDSLTAAITVVRSRGKYDVGLMGSSFGGLVSIIVASRDSQVAALALKSPVTEPITFWKQRLGDKRIAKWKREGVMHYNEHGEHFELNYSFWEDLTTYKTHEMAKDITCPILIVHGDSDSVVPIRQSQDLAIIINTELRIVKGANHNYADTSQYNKMKKSIIEFLIEKLSR